MAKLKRSRYLSIILALAMVFAMLSVAGAAPRNAAHAEGEKSTLPAQEVVLTVTVPAGVTGYIYAYYWDSQEKWWYSAGYADISGNKAVFNRYTYEDEEAYETNSIFYAIGKSVTLRYYPDTIPLKKLYGESQTLGGYFGYPNDDGAKPTPFTLTKNLSKPFTPVKGALITLKVTPADSATVDTYAYAQEIVKGKAGLTVRGDSVSPVNELNGVHSFVVQPGKSYVLYAYGSIKQGLVWVSYPTTWSGGLKGPLPNKPAASKLKVVKAGAGGTAKVAKAIALKLGSATIKGKTAAGESVSIRNPFTQISYSAGTAQTATGQYTTSYSQKVEPGFYIVSDGITQKFVAVKAKKSKAVNFTTSAEPKYDSWSADISISVSGKLKKGEKLKASVKLHNLTYKATAPKFKYVWTDGTKILGKKASYKLKKADLKKGKKIFVVAHGTKYNYTNYSWHIVK
jgi:hypothetical protein